MVLKSITLSSLMRSLSSRTNYYNLLESEFDYSGGPYYGRVELYTGKILQILHWDCILMCFKRSRVCSCIHVKQAGSTY